MDVGCGERCRALRRQFAAAHGASQYGRSAPNPQLCRSYGRGLTPARADGIRVYETTKDARKITKFRVQQLTEVKLSHCLCGPEV